VELPKVVSDDEAISAEDQKDYIKKTGKVNYLAIGTRGDISYTVGKLCEANAKASPVHVQVLHHLFRYIKGTIALCVILGGPEYTVQDLQLHVHADAAFANCALTRYSTGGHVVTLAGAPVFWKTKKQTMMTVSSTEAEFINLTPAGISLLWIAKMLGEFGAPQKEPLLLFTDSANALTTAFNLLKSARTRSIDIRYKWIIDQVKKGTMIVRHKPGTEMVADGLTKALGKNLHPTFVKLL
jgi:hypothetical protein